MSTPLSPHARNVALVVAATLFMQFLDGVIIVTALPRMASDFGVQTLEMSLGVTIYMLAVAVCIPAAAWLSDRFGARRVFLAAIAVFTLTSIGCGLAQDLGQFALARALQGAGSSVLFPVGRIIVLRTAAKSEIVPAIGLTIWPALFAPVIGPALGGFITEFISWHWNFWINIPLGIVGMVLVYAPPGTRVNPGDRVRATGRLVEAGEWDRFSYADYLARSGVYSLLRDASVEVVAPAEAIPPLVALRTQAAALIARHLPEPQAGLLTGILLGNERGIAPELTDAFAVTGAAHVIAISGFNMVLISGMVIGTLKRLNVPRRLAGVIAVGVIVTYTILVGASAGVVRAAIMSSLLVIAELLRRKTYTPASLAFAALILSAHNPTVLWDVGFQLSFFAALGLATFSKPIGARLDPLLGRILPARLKGLIAEPLITTIAVSILTLPLAALHFGRLSPAMLPVNLLILPLQPPLLVLGGLATIIAFTAPAVAQIVYWIDMLPLSWTIGVVRLFANVPAAEVYPHPNAAAVYVGIRFGGMMLHAAQPAWAVNLSRLIRRRAVIAAALFAGSAVLLLTAAIVMSRPAGRLHVWFFDMGGSNAVLITTPGGVQMLVDGGRYPSRLLAALGDRLPFTDRAIDLLVLTQPDERQYAALPALLARYQIGAVVSHEQPNLSDPYASLQNALAPYPQVEARAGYSVDCGDGVQLEVLHPPRQPQLDDPLDDGALVLRVSHGEVSFLRTADLSAAGQEALLASGQSVYAPVLQVPQNGRTRSLNADFLSAVAPQVAVVQADDLMPPDPDALALLGNIPLYRTDRGGTIHLVSDGDDVWVSYEG